MNSIESSKEDTKYLIAAPKFDTSQINNLKDNLAIFYFDQKMGPSVLYSNNMEMLEDFELSRFLDVLDSGTFIFALNGYHTINHISFINDDLARGREIPFMISYMINNREMEETYRYLESKTIVLEDFAKEIKNLDGMRDLLDQNTRFNEILHESPFLKIFKKCYERLSLKFKILKPINELKPSSIDIYTIKLYLIPSDLAQIIYSVLRGEHLVMQLNKETELEKKIRDFIHFLFHDSFKAAISTKYKKFSKNQSIVQVLNKQKISEYIKDSIKRFYNERNDIIALLNLRDTIRELYVLSKSILEYTEESRSKFLHRKIVIRDLEKLFYVKIKRDYFEILSQIVEHYYKTEIYWIHEFVAEKIDEMWR